jgi:4-carboxymuconolactone decarboxylase
MMISALARGTGRRALEKEELTVARISYVDPSEAPPPVRDALEKIPQLNVFKIAAHASSAFRPFLRYGGTLLARLELDPSLRELAILRVSVLADCDYERVQHEAIARGIGIPQPQIATATDPGADGEGVEALVYRLVAETFRENRATAATTDALVAELGERGLVELLLVVGQYHGLAVLMNTAEIDFDEEAGLAVLESARSPRPGRE